MNQMNKSRARRRNIVWTEEEIEKLIDWRLIEFLPQEYVDEERLSPEEQGQILKAATPHLSQSQVESLDRELGLLKRQELLGPQRDRTIRAAAARVVPLSESWSGLGHAHSYLRASLGLRVSPDEIEPNMSDPKVRKRLNRGRLAEKSQRPCFLEWTDVFEDTWSSPTWRECMWMRYGERDMAAIKFLNAPSRRILDAEAKRLLSQVSPDKATSQQLEEAAAKVGLRLLQGAAHQAIRVDYLRARLRGKLTRQHPLYKPISQSGLFESIATCAAEGEASSEQTRPSYVKRFLRYLTTPSGHADYLVGQILYAILRLDADLWEDPTATLPQFEGIQWPVRLRPKDVQPPRDFRLIADRFAAALEVDRRVFTEIWQAHVTLTLRRFWAKRTSVQMTVFWAARLLEGLRPDVYKVYGQLVDYFHENGIRALIKEEKDGKAEGPMRRAMLAPLFYALLEDPLLNCILHTEVLNGRGRLFPRGGRLRDDGRARSLLSAYCVHRLRGARPTTPTIAVNEVLPDTVPLTAHVRHAATPSTRDRGERIQGYSHFAYAAPLVASIVDDPHWSLTADIVKDIYHRYEGDAEVQHLLSNLDKEGMTAVRGRS